jgi:hypothetical protein
MSQNTLNSTEKHCEHQINLVYRMMMMVVELIQIYSKMNREMLLMLSDRFVRNLKRFFQLLIVKNKEDF